MDLSTGRFLRDLALMGLPGVLMAALLARWQPWSLFRSHSVITFPYEPREAEARAAGIRETQWHGIRIHVPDDFVILSQDSVLEVLELAAPDYGKGSWGSHLALLPLTRSVHDRLEQQASNCTLAPGRCWNAQVGHSRVFCQQAAGSPVPELWWTPLTVCEVPKRNLWLAWNAPDQRRAEIWELAQAILRENEAIDKSASREP